MCGRRPERILPRGHALEQNQFFLNNVDIAAVRAITGTIRPTIGQKKVRPMTAALKKIARIVKVNSSGVPCDLLPQERLCLPESAGEKEYRVRGRARTESQCLRHRL